jgi:hypothetical protein
VFREKFTQSLFVHHKYHTVGINPGLCGEKSVTVLLVLWNILHHKLIPYDAAKAHKVARYLQQLLNVGFA